MGGLWQPDMMLGAINIRRNEKYSYAQEANSLVQKPEIQVEKLLKTWHDKAHRRCEPDGSPMRAGWWGKAAPEGTTHGPGLKGWAGFDRRSRKAQEKGESRQGWFAEAERLAQYESRKLLLNTPGDREASSCSAARTTQKRHPEGEESQRYRF